MLKGAGAILVFVAALFVVTSMIWTAPTKAFDAGAPAWLGHTKLVVPALVFWGFPWVGTIGVLIYLAGLQNIATDVYEAAELDGVGPVRMLFHIELPLITTAVRINLIFMTIGTLTGYGLFLVLLGHNGGPGNAATLITMFTLLQQLGLINNLWALVITGAVGGQVVCVFILKQFIEEIPHELFESAQIDGAGHLQQVRHIVMPTSGPILGTLAIMQFISNWNNLILPLVIMRDDELLTIPVGLMRLEFAYVKQWGELMAAYTISSIPLVVLFLFTMRLFVKGALAGAIKG